MKVDDQALASDFLQLLFSLHNKLRRPSRACSELNANSRAFGILFLLKAQMIDEALSMSQLASKLQMPNQQLSKLVATLEEQGFVERLHSQKNRRVVYIRITALGKERIAQMSQFFLNQLTPQFQKLTEEEKQDLLHSMATFQHILEKLQFMDTPPSSF